MTLVTATLTLGAVSRPFTYRAGTSDEAVLRGIFQNGQYQLERFGRGAELQDYVVRHSRETGLQPLIVDAGANIGAASLFFAMLWPTAQLVAIEPDAENYFLLLENTRGLAVDCRLAAAASTEGYVSLSDPEQGPWAYRTDMPAATGQIPTVTMNALYAARAATHFPFIAKIDIEGAEGELFSQHLDWVAQTPIIMIELHDWLLPKQRTAQNFLRSVAGLDRDFLHHGESVFSIRNNL